MCSIWKIETGTSSLDGRVLAECADQETAHAVFLGIVGFALAHGGIVDASTSGDDAHCTVVVYGGADPDRWVILSPADGADPAASAALLDAISEFHEVTR